MPSLAALFMFHAKRILLIIPPQQSGTNVFLHSFNTHTHSCSNYSVTHYV